MHTDKHSFPFLQNTGEVGKLIRQKDWKNSALGSPDGWPPSLRIITNLALNSKFPMFIAWGKNYSFIYNDAYAEILGEKHPQALGANFQDVWTEIWDNIQPIVLHSMDGHGSYCKDMPLVTSRKGYNENTWFTFSYSPIHDEEGCVAGMYCVCIETTNEMLAEQHRVRELERMRELFRQAPGFTAVVREPHHIFELANDAFLELIGNREIIGRNLQDAIPELEDQGFVATLNSVYNSGEPYIGNAVPLRLRRAPEQPLEQRFVDFIYQPIRDYQGQVSGVFIQGNDVTEKVNATKALRESEERLRQLANTIPQLAWVAHPDGKVHWYNDRWYAYTGTTAETMQAQGWERFYAPEVIEDATRQWQDSITYGLPFEGTFPLRSAHNEYRMFYTRMVPLSDSDGHVVQWFGTGTDVTVLEEAKNDLKAADARKDEFLAMLAHELRNPLAPIRSAAELLKIEGIPREKILKSCDIISRQVGNLTRQLDDLLDVAHVTRGLVMIRPTSCHLSELVTEATEQVRPIFQLKRQKFLADIPIDACFLNVDRVRIVQVLANVLDNAAKYTPEGGSITLQAVAEPEFVTITVTDSGVGIAKQLLSHVFELFTQAERSPDRSQGGLGLGLALVKNLVELHGGYVFAYSDGVGKGSKFVIKLPRTQAPPEMAASPSELHKEKPEKGKLQVIVVDDKQDAAQTIVTLLEKNGYMAHAAYSSLEALELAQRVRANVFLLDIGLPGMNGYELARRLRKLPETAQCCLIAHTGYGQREDVYRTQEVGFDDHFVKPVEFKVILDVLSKIKRSGDFR